MEKELQGVEFRDPVVLSTCPPTLAEYLPHIRKALKQQPGKYQGLIELIQDSEERSLSAFAEAIAIVIFLDGYRELATQVVKLRQGRRGVAVFKSQTISLDQPMFGADVNYVMIKGFGVECVVDTKVPVRHNPVIRQFMPLDP